MYATGLFRQTMMYMGRGRVMLWRQVANMSPQKYNPEPTKEAKYNPLLCVVQSTAVLDRPDLGRSFLSLRAKCSFLLCVSYV